MAEYLASLGNVVERVEYKGSLRFGDFLVNGVRVELKSPTALVDAGSKQVSAKLSSSILKARGQAWNMIIDVREQAGASADVLHRTLERARGADRNKRHIREVIFLTSDGPIITKLHGGD